MGKFSEVLKKSEKVKRRRVPPPITNDIVHKHNDKDNDKRDMAEVIGTTKESETLSNGNIDPRLVAHLGPSTTAAERFKILRAKLLFGRNGKSSRTILVSSPQPLDGKSLVASNLAVSIARGLNEHVVLVDCDLRRPTLHQIFGLNSNHGLRGYLEEGSCVSSYMLKTSVDKLTLLPAGEPPKNPSELLSSDKMRQLITELKTRYNDRYIIFDTPPSQFTPEGNFMASMVDGVLLVVRSGKTSKDLLVQAVNNIGREKILGIVFNAVNGNDQGIRSLYKAYLNGGKR